MNIKNDSISLLLVEDNPSDVALIRALLKDVDGTYFEVRDRSYLRDAMDSIKDATPDIVLVDLGLPDAEGLEAIRQLRSCGDLPLVVLTGNVDDQLAIDSLRFGAQDYLVKTNLDSDRLVRGLRYAIERKRAEVEMSDLREEVAQLANRQQRWVAQELHDGLGQHLTGLGMMAKSLQRQLHSDGSPRSEFASELVDLIGEAQQIVRRLIRGVDPVDVSEGGLQQALENLAQTTQQQCGIACCVSRSEPVFVENHDVAVQLYRIAQEAIHNAVKHSGTDTIDIRLQWDVDQLIVQVSDQGRGFVVDETMCEGRGLRIMRYRAETIHGRLELVTQPQQGASVRCVVPGEFAHGERRLDIGLGNQHA